MSDPDYTVVIDDDTITVVSIAEQGPPGPGGTTNLDGGDADTIYGGTTAIDGGDA